MLMLDISAIKRSLTRASECRFTSQDSLCSLTHFIHTAAAASLWWVCVWRIWGSIEQITSGTHASVRREAESWVTNLHLCKGSRDWPFDRCRCRSKKAQSRAGTKGGESFGRQNHLKICRKLWAFENFDWECSKFSLCLKLYWNISFNFLWRGETWRSPSSLTLLVSRTLIARWAIVMQWHLLCHNQSVHEKGYEIGSSVERRGA